MHPRAPHGGARQPGAARDEAGDGAGEHVAAPRGREPRATAVDAPDGALGVGDQVVAADDGSVAAGDVTHGIRQVALDVVAERLTLQKGELLTIGSEDEPVRQPAPIDAGQDAEGIGVEHEARRSRVGDGEQGVAGLVGVVEARTHEHGVGCGDLPPIRLLERVGGTIGQGVDGGLRQHDADLGVDRPRDEDPQPPRADAQRRLPREHHSPGRAAGSPHHDDIAARLLVGTGVGQPPPGEHLAGDRLGVDRLLSAAHRAGSCSASAACGSPTSGVPG